MNKPLQSPLDDHSRSSYNSLPLSILSSFILRKQHEKVPGTAKKPDEIKKPQRSMHPPSNTLLSINSHPTSIQPNTSQKICITSFSRHTDKFFTEIFNLLRTHVEVTPNTDTFITQTHSFDTYRSLQNPIQFQTNCIHNVNSTCF